MPDKALAKATFLAKFRTKKCHLSPLKQVFYGTGIGVLQTHC